MYVFQKFHFYISLIASWILDTANSVQMDKDQQRAKYVLN